MHCDDACLITAFFEVGEGEGEGCGRLRMRCGQLEAKVKKDVMNVRKKKTTKTHTLKSRKQTQEIEFSSENDETQMPNNDQEKCDDVFVYAILVRNKNKHRKLNFLHETQMSTMIKKNVTMSSCIQLYLPDNFQLAQ
jgi:hypothetical protein